MTIGTLYVDSWAGRTKHKVLVLKETPKRFKVRLLDGFLRWKEGQEIYVPKDSVIQHFGEASCERT